MRFANGVTNSGGGVEGRLQL